MNIWGGVNSTYVLNRYLWIDRIQRRDDIRDGLLADTIDVFVMDNCPDNVIICRIKVLLIKIMQGMMKDSQNEKNYSLLYKICLWLTHIIGKPFSAERKFRWYHKIAQIGNSNATRYLTGYTDLYKLLSLKYSGSLFKSIGTHRFENIDLPITAEYDSYLITQYGDYNTPPKEEDRKPIHISFT